jgi:uncharacterized protein YcaQ
VDLKADRRTGTLRVPSAWIEEGAVASGAAVRRGVRRGVPDAGEVAVALAGELRRLAGWLGLDRVALPEGGDFAVALASALGSAAAEPAGGVVGVP